MSCHVSLSAANRIVALPSDTDHDDSALRNDAEISTGVTGTEHLSSPDENAHPATDGPNSPATLGRAAWIDPAPVHMPVQRDERAGRRTDLEATFYVETVNFRINEKD